MLRMKPLCSDNTGLEDILKIFALTTINNLVFVGAFNEGKKIYEHHIW